MSERKHKVATLLMTGSLVFAAAAYSQEPGEKTFATPQDASTALYNAVKSGDKAATQLVLGKSSASVISSGDDVQDKNSRDHFVERYEQMHRWGKDADGSDILYVGAENWPLPIPLRKASAGWYFDTKSGEQEILFRRIGGNELAAIRVCHALVDGERDYYSQLRDGAAVKQYAQKFGSDPGKQDGLYWKAAEGEPLSPIGPLVAYAHGKGYGGHHEEPQPFHGYFFRILTSQGPKAKGGAKSYIVNGQMTGGFAVVAYPAEYRNSGVKTFLVNQDGIIYEKDLGPNTVELASQMPAYNPDATWTVVQEDE